MMWKEFEKIAGYEVSYETYSKVIEPMYMAIPEGISKQQFVKMLDKKAFALPTRKELIKKMQKTAREIFEGCGRTSFIEEFEEVQKTADEFAHRFYGEDAGVLIATLYAYCGIPQDRGCSYPAWVVFFDGKTGNEYETIHLVRV